MFDVVGIDIQNEGIYCNYRSFGLLLKIGDKCILEDSDGAENWGQVIYKVRDRDVENFKHLSVLKNVFRKCAETDFKIIEKNSKLEKEAMEFCKEKIIEKVLPMKLIDLKWAFNGKKVTVCFTAQKRLDFRELVKEIAQRFKLHVEMKHIGAREETKICKGYGICGRPLCCATFINVFEPVSINMAKTQNLTLDPSKISGVCGRLMCCLRYELD